MSRLVLYLFLYVDYLSKEISTYLHFTGILGPGVRPIGVGALGVPGFAPPLLATADGGGGDHHSPLMCPHNHQLRHHKPLQCTLPEKKLPTHLTTLRLSWDCFRKTRKTNVRTCLENVRRKKVKTFQISIV